MQETKAKIDKTVVKALAANVLYQGANVGLLATTSEFSPGARDVVHTRDYPIIKADRNAVRRWLDAMRTPGVGGWMME